MQTQPVSKHQRDGLSVRGEFVAHIDGEDVTITIQVVNNTVFIDRSEATICKDTVLTFEMTTEEQMDLAQLLERQAAR